jgi:hypothetical protein
MKISESLLMSMKKSLLCCLLIAACLGRNAFARDFYRIGQDYRSLAMGNTGIASANNSSALFYNPAAMSNIFNWWVDFPMIQATYSDDARDLYETFRNGLNLETQDEQFEFMEDNIGKNPYVSVAAGINGFVNMDKKGFTIGGNYLYEAIFDIEVRNKSAPEIVAFERVDLIRQVGFSYPIGLGKLVLGLAYRQVDRQELSFTYDFIDATNEKKFPTLEDDGITGSGSAFDVGFLYRTSTAAHLSWGAVWRNEVKFNKDGVSDIPSQLDLGVSLRQENPLLRWILALDLRDVTLQLGSDDADAGDKSYYRRIHLGTELGILPIDKTISFFSFRAGYNSGYLTYGAEVALSRVMVIGYTKFIEETGEYAGQKPSPRTALYLSIGF